MEEVRCADDDPGVVTRRSTAEPHLRDTMEPSWKVIFSELVSLYSPRGGLGAAARFPGADKRFGVAAAAAVKATLANNSAFIANNTIMLKSVHTKSSINILSTSVW